MSDDMNLLNDGSDAHLDTETSLIIHYAMGDLPVSLADDVRVRLETDEPFRRKAAPFLMVNEVFRSPAREFPEFELPSHLEDFMRHVELTRTTPLSSLELPWAQRVWDDVAHRCGLARSDVRMHRPIEQHTLWQKLVAWPHWTKVAIAATIAIIAAAIAAVIYVYEAPRSLPVPAGVHAASAPGGGMQLPTPMLLVSYARRDSTLTLASGTTVRLTPGSSFTQTKSLFADSGILRGSATIMAKRKFAVSSDSAATVLREGQFQVFSSPGELRVRVIHGKARLYGKRTPYSQQLVITDGQVGRVVTGKVPERVVAPSPAGTRS